MKLTQRGNTFLTNQLLAEKQVTQRAGLYSLDTPGVM